MYSIATDSEHLAFGVLYLVLLSCFIYLFVLMSSPRGAANVCLWQYGIALAHSYSFLYNINYIMWRVVVQAKSREGNTFRCVVDAEKLSLFRKTCAKKYRKAL